MNPRDYLLPFPPYRLTGTVYGALLNDRRALEALGESVHEPPYKGAPKAPVLYVKPRNTFRLSGACVTTSEAIPEWEVGGSLAIVMGRTACRISANDALGYVAGYTVAADLSIPHESFYRPSIRFKARDGSLVVGKDIVQSERVGDPARLTLRSYLDGKVVQESSLGDMVRSTAQLLADVTDFMTLAPGDMLLLGVPHGAPRARAGQRAVVEIENVGVVQIGFAGDEQ